MKKLNIAPRFLLLSCLLLGLSACNAPSGQEKAKEDSGAKSKQAVQNDLDTAPAKTTTLKVKAVVAKVGKLSVQRSATATIQAERDSNVATKSSGTVQQVLVQEGQQVQPGQMIMRLDETNQRQAVENAQLQVQQARVSLQQTQNNTAQATAVLKAALRSAEASLKQAKQVAGSSEKLYKVGGMSESDLQAARSQLAQVESQVVQARNNLEQNGKNAQSSIPLQKINLESAQNTLKQARENLARTMVRAPFAGVVADLKLEQGEFANQGAVAFRLVDPGSIRAKLNVPTTDAGTLTKGAQFNLGYGGVNYVATVLDSTGIAGGNRLVPVTARVEGGERIPVGASAQARYRVVLGEGVLIPSSSLMTERGENVVYIVQNQQAKRQKVKVVAESSGQLAVQNLSDGVRVISPVPASLQDGASIQVEGQP